MNLYETQADALLPIREISRLTGVNTVTLRAWERRYGLLKPMRTAKGHRLYSNEDVQRVKTIQTWLARGLAISKVKDILARKMVVDETEFSADNVWLSYVARIEAALDQLQRAPLTDLLNELSALYPAELIADQLLAPVLEGLEVKAAFGTATRLAFLGHVVREHFYFGHYRQRQTACGKRLLLVKLDPAETDILPLILNYSFLVNGYRAEYLGYLPFAELVYAVEQAGAEGLVLYSDSALSLGQLHRQLMDWQQMSSAPVFIAGKITRMLLADNRADHLLAGDRLQLVLATLIEVLPYSCSDTRAARGDVE